MGGVAVLLTLLCALTVSVSGQTCVSFNATIARTFAGVIPEGTLIYTISNLTTLESLAIDSSVPLSSITNRECRDAYARLAALRIFQPCDVTQWGVGQAYPRLPCRSLCENVNSVCHGGDLNIIRFSLTDTAASVVCTNAGTFVPGQPDYPVASTSFPSSVTTQCYSLGAVNVAFGKCTNYTGLVCKGLVASSVFLGPGYCLQDLESQLSAITTVVETLSQSCAKAVSRLFCNIVLMPCDSNSVQGQLQAISGDLFGTLPPTPFPRFPDRQMCLDLHASCPGKPFVAGYGNASAASLGWYPDLTSDMGKLSYFTRLGGSLAQSLLPPPTCDTRLRAPNKQVDFPSNMLFVGQKQTQMGLVTLTVPTNTQPSLQDAVPNVGRCVPFNSQDIETYSLRFLPSGMPRKDQPKSYCKNIVPEGTLVYTPVGLNLSLLNEQVRKGHWLYPLLPTAQDCHLTFLKYLCWQAFMPCRQDVMSIQMDLAPNLLTANDTTRVPTTVTLSATFPRFPCRDVCTTFETQCAAFLEKNPLLRPNCTKREMAPSAPGFIRKLDCNGTVVSAGQLDFPTASTWFLQLIAPLPGISNPLTLQAVPAVNWTLPLLPFSVPVATQCHGNSASPLPAIRSAAQFATEVECNWPAANPWHPDEYGRVATSTTEFIEGGSCAIVCPLPLYTEEQYNPAFRTWTALTVMSLLMLAFLLATYTIFKERRERSRYLFWFMVCTFMVGIGCSFSVFSGEYRMNCVNRGEPATMGVEGSGFCVLQGLWVHLSALSACIWWAIQSLDLLLNLGMNRQSPVQKELFRKIYHCLGWGIPLLMMIIALATKTYGSFGRLAACTFNNTTLDWVVFYVPVLCCIAVGTASMVIIIVTILQARKAAGIEGNTKCQRLMFVWRPICFILSFWVVFMVIFAYKAYQVAEYDALHASAKDWVMCKLFQEQRAYFLDGDTAFSCGDRPAHAPDVTIFTLVQVVVAGSGVFVFVTHGSELRNFTLWRDKFFRKKKLNTPDNSPQSSMSNKRNLNSVTPKTKTRLLQQDTARNTPNSTPGSGTRQLASNKSGANATTTTSNANATAIGLDNLKGPVASDASPALASPPLASPNSGKSEESPAGSALSSPVASSAPSNAV